MVLPRTAPDSVLFTTYNVLNLFQDDSSRGREHYQLVVDSIRALNTDMLAIQGNPRAGRADCAAATAPAGR